MKSQIIKRDQVRIVPPATRIRDDENMDEPVMFDILSHAMDRLHRLLNDLELAAYRDHIRPEVFREAMAEIDRTFAEIKEYGE
ncbi:MAG: hypothetical protein ACE14T_12260 [Syntrophales bacterium]